MSETPMQGTATQQQPRGAGSGEKANATRSRNLVDWPPKPEPHGQKVDELEAEAEAQADFNDQMNEIQTKQVEEFEKKMIENSPAEEDPDKAREEAQQAYETTIDPKKKQAALKGEMDARAKREKAAAEAK